MNNDCLLTSREQTESISNKRRLYAKPKGWRLKPDCKRLLVILSSLTFIVFFKGGDKLLGNRMFLGLSTLFFSSSDVKLYKVPKNRVAFLCHIQCTSASMKKAQWSSCGLMNTSLDTTLAGWVGTSCLKTPVASERISWAWGDGIVRDCDTPVQHSHWSYLVDDWFYYAIHLDVELWFLSKEKYKLYAEIKIVWVRITIYCLVGTWPHMFLPLLNFSSWLICFLTCPFK